MPPLIFRIWADDYSARKSNTLQETSLLGGRLGQLGYLGSLVVGRFIVQVSNQDQLNLHRKVWRAGTCFSIMSFVDKNGIFHFSKFLRTFEEENFSTLYSTCTTHTPPLIPFPHLLLLEITTGYKSVTNTDSIANIQCFSVSGQLLEWRCSS